MREVRDVYIIDCCRKKGIYAILEALQKKFPATFWIRDDYPVFTIRMRTIHNDAFITQVRAFARGFIYFF